MAFPGASGHDAGYWSGMAKGLLHALMNPIPPPPRWPTGWENRGFIFAVLTITLLVSTGLLLLVHPMLPVFVVTLPYWMIAEMFHAIENHNVGDFLLSVFWFSPSALILVTSVVALMRRSKSWTIAAIGCILLHCVACVILLMNAPVPNSN